MSNLIPHGYNREQLAEVLRDMATRVEAGDSFEGNIEYMMPMPEPDLPPGWPGWPSTDCDFWVTGVYRVGNLQGQGGIRMIGTVPGTQPHDV